MGMVNWDGFRFKSEWITETKECCTCREKVPVDKLLSTGMCQRCTDIENKMLERLAGKWGQMISDSNEEIAVAIWGRCPWL